jgi:hypothetical protein
MRSHFERPVAHQGPVRVFREYLEQVELAGRQFFLVYLARRAQDAPFDIEHAASHAHSRGGCRSGGAADRQLIVSTSATGELGRCSYLEQSDIECLIGRER